MLLITRDLIEQFIEKIDDRDYFAGQIEPDLDFDFDTPEKRTYTGSDGFPVEYEEVCFTANGAEVTSVNFGGLSWYNVHFKREEALVEGAIWCSYEAEAQVYGGDWDDPIGLENTGYTKTGEDEVLFNISIHRNGDEMVWELV